MRLPPAVGVNVTLIVHEPPTSTLDAHVLVSEKSPGSDPLMLMFDMTSGAVPLFVTVTFCGLLEVPTI
jgi:hypothetical protein